MYTRRKVGLHLQGPLCASLPNGPTRVPGSNPALAGSLSLPAGLQLGFSLAPGPNWGSREGAQSRHSLPCPSPPTTHDFQLHLNVSFGRRCLSPPHCHAALHPLPLQLRFPTFLTQTRKTGPEIRWVHLPPPPSQSAAQGRSSRARRGQFLTTLSSSDTLGTSDHRIPEAGSPSAEPLRQREV